MSVTRRNLVKSAAWAAPVVVATAAVPAYAASFDEPHTNPNLRWNGSSRVNHFVEDNYHAHVFPNPGGPFGVQYQNVVPEDTVSDLSITYWLPYDNFTFTSQPDSSPFWTTLSRDNTREPRVATQNGAPQTVYPYTTYWVGGSNISETGQNRGGGTYWFPKYDFFSNEGDPSIWRSYLYQIRMRINGGPLENKNGLARTQVFTR
ncbi:hypothetical protein ACN081_07895 [Rothia sp. P13129]|uniref:hypothetical protein n=1 Tax=Rothia sp. P13129 TaxID=3402664 RepID=UPI003AC2B759